MTPGFGGVSRASEDRRRELHDGMQTTRSGQERASQGRQFRRGSEVVGLVYGLAVRAYGQVKA